MSTGENDQANEKTSTCAKWYMDGSKRGPQMGGADQEWLHLPSDIWHVRRSDKPITQYFQYCEKHEARRSI